MGGIAVAAARENVKYLSAEYSCTSGRYSYSFRIMLDSKHATLNLINTLRDNHPEKSNPFSTLCHLSVSEFEIEDLSQLLKVIERPLIFHRRFLFWRIYHPTIRLLTPIRGSEKVIGMLIANPTEQEKLRELFQEALVRLLKL